MYCSPDKDLITLSPGSPLACLARYLRNTMVDLTCICVDGDKYGVNYGQTVAIRVWIWKT
jgi:hypothetical protein